MHVFEQIAQHHSIVSIKVDPNFKIGARSKKGMPLAGTRRPDDPCYSLDPTVRIVAKRGSEESLAQARDEVLKLCDSKTNRVTLKVELANDQHYFIIGRKVR